MFLTAIDFVRPPLFRFPAALVSKSHHLRCHSTALVPLTDEEKYYYREIPSYDAKLTSAAPADLYELLGLDHDAQIDDIKTAYREKQRIAHPDIAGDDAEEISALLNQAYKTLMDESLRQQYDHELHLFLQHHGVFDGQPMSGWCGSYHEQRAVFVDETTCIGCTNCTTCAPKTFQMEDVWGRARVMHQWGDEEEWIREAIDMCPVDCIYIVQKRQLALLEFVMKFCDREDAAILARRRSGNMGSAPSKNNPFTKAEDFMNSRKRAKMSNNGQECNGTQNEAFASMIAKAWLQLPEHVRAKGWPSWSQMNTEV